MTDEKQNFDSSVHFRVTKDFMPRVHKVARSRGMTASNYIRSAVYDALEIDQIRELHDEENLAMPPSQTL